MKWLREWRRRHVRRQRILRGMCVSCGEGKPLQGATLCRACFAMQQINRLAREGKQP